MMIASHELLRYTEHWNIRTPISHFLRLLCFPFYLKIIHFLAIILNFKTVQDTLLINIVTANKWGSDRSDFLVFFLFFFYDLYVSVLQFLLFTAVLCFSRTSVICNDNLIHSFTTVMKYQLNVSSFIIQCFISHIPPFNKIIIYYYLNRLPWFNCKLYF